MEENKTNRETGLIYGLEDRPPLKDTLFAALQHLLAIFVAIITPPLIIAGALKLDLEPVFWYQWLCLRQACLHLYSVGVLVLSAPDCFVYKVRAFRLSDL